MSLIDTPNTPDDERDETTPQHEKVEGIESPEDASSEERAFPPIPEKKPGLFGPRRSKQKADATAGTAPGGDAPQPKKRGVLPRVSKWLVGGFADPVTRPRYIIVAGMSIFLVAALMIVALGVTSTRWFCSEGCHKVQDDTITAYQHSSHANISCMSCHMPVGANPAIFLVHKAEALGELYLAVTNQFELPLNGESEVGLTMPAKQCTQCHNLNKRKITPATGILINHQVHADKGIQCGVCHNRVAHKEDFLLVLKDPATGEPNRKHDDFMTMTACFRCHTQGKEGGDLTAPGKCGACHPKDFQLKPASHREDGFFPKGHAKLAEAAAAREESATARIEKAEAEKPAAEGASEELGPGLKKVETINECSTCHSPKFCTDCHGLPMPHPPSFREGHAEFGRRNAKACVRCHGRADQFCDACHHGTSLDRAYDTSRPWIKQHFIAVRETGASKCFSCHTPVFCARCHVRGSTP